ncbi:MAG: HIT family protein [Bacteroidota bacterium]|jgi:histidine triad (HIT) family protein
MPSIFSRIVAGDIPCYRIAENDNYLAFLDVNPLVLGHVLVIPKKEVDYIFDLDQDEYVGLMTFAQKVAKALKNAVPCKRVGVAVIGLEVPHAHVHLVPLNTMSDINFSMPKQQFPKEVMEETAARISSAVK